MAELLARVWVVMAPTSGNIHGAYASLQTAQFAQAEIGDGNPYRVLEFVPAAELERVTRQSRSWHDAYTGEAENAAKSEARAIKAELHARALAEAADDLCAAADKAAMSINRHDDGEAVHAELLEAHDACLAAMTPMALALQVARTALHQETQAGECAERAAAEQPE